MDQRKFPRQGLGVEAVFVIGDDGGNNGVIQDFNQDGLFITYVDDNQFIEFKRRRIDPGTGLDVILEQDGRQVSIPARIVHINDSGIGVTLTGDKRRSYQLLDTARRRNDAAALDTANQFVSGHRISDDARKIKILNACNDHLKAFLNEMLPEYFVTLDEILIKEASKQKNDAAQHPFFDAIAYFKRSRNRLPEFIIGKLVSDAQDIVHGRYKAPVSASAQSSNGAELSLVEKSDFEDWLIMRVVVSRAELQLRDPMIELQLRLDAAFGKEDGKRLVNPYAPSAIAQSYHTAIHGYKLSSTLERLVFKAFQEVVLSNLSRLYKSLNNTFVKFGVLPDVDVTRYLAAEAMKKHKSANPLVPKPVPAPQQSTAKPAQPAPASTPASTSAAVSTSAAPATPVPAAATSPLRASSGAIPGAYSAVKEGLERARNAYSAATRLMSVHRKLEQENPAQVRQPDMHQQPLPPNQPVFQAINSMQQRLLQGSIDLNEAGSLPHYLAQASGVNVSQLPVQELESAEMVENLFSNIVEHQRILSDLRPELRKLEVPILRVLLQDPKLFSVDYHPARQMVNYVALLADRDSVNVQANRPAIVDSIRLVLEAPQEDSTIFDAALGKLDKLVEREKKIIERNVARVTEACEGQQRVKLGNERVERELARRLSDILIPKAMHDLVQTGWKDLMRLCFFREGVESRAWEMTLVVIDQLVLRLVAGRYDEQALLFKVEELVKLIRKGLSKVPSARHKHEVLIDELEELLKNGVTATTELVAWTETKRPDDVDVQPEDDDKTLQRWVKRARSLKEAQWLEFDARSESSHLYQLAWIADQQARFVFVNHHGMKVSDLALEEVAHKLKSGDVVVLSDAGLPAVEKGLDSLVQKIYDQLAFESAHDQLTSMKTRKEFERCLAQAVARSKRNNQYYVLIYMDILQFKVINNTCGYEAGDSLLREVGERIRSVLGDDMVAGRIGGNEFAILVPNESEHKGFLLATEFKTAVEEKRFSANNQSFVIEIVMSLVGFDQHNDQVLELLRSVESAAVITKKSGHKEIQVVRPGDSRIEERDEVMSWVARINRALDQNTLKLRCQKIAPVAADSVSLPHYEILLTVVDDKGEHLPPADFIRAAEEYSRMGSVDRWVIETVLGWMVKNRSVLEKLGGFSINLSGHSMNDDSFLDFMFENLVRYEVPRDKLIFEVTETTAVANLEDAADFIQEMRSIGCRFSLDDFGAGQSSYAYLKKLPVDFIKIDGAFIRNIASDDVDYALVKSITEMGHFLNKKIIAEYVSDADILEVVSDIGVDYVQGYHLGRPQLLEELACGEAIA